MNMELTANVEQMLSTIQSHVEKLDVKIGKIDDRLNDIIRIEERQSSDRTALNRMGKEIDELKSKVVEQHDLITKLRISSATTALKITLYGGGGGSLATAIAGGILWWISKGQAQIS